ncbi:MAG: dihydroorotate dehydrogenase-like protein [Bacteroidales bacterium]|nr:dihydroorotate dehydrogenase-like protein [Bacteroidales bacterium]
MADLATKYMGLELKNPLIAGSCGITSKVEDIIQLEQAGIAAVVLKSIFEEEILNEASFDLKEAENNKFIYTQLSETLDYIDVHTKEKRFSNYLNLIKEAKSKTLIPIIASINCITDSEWIEYAAKIESAGADAIELNIALSPMDINLKDADKIIIRIIKKVLKAVKIPVAVKIGECFTNLAGTILEIDSSGVAGIVLFNRFYSPDIDIYNLDIVTGRKLSCDTDYLKPLRWIALMSDRIKCSIAASTGIQDSNTAIKQILAGADAVQIVSAIYLNGKEYITEILTGIEKWMFEKGIFSVQQFKGLASYKKATNPSVYERIQFMKYYGRIV